MRIGSLFSGYGGLDMAVEAFTGGTVAWHAEMDKAASRVLAAHWDVPNLGDVSKVDWATAEPVDVLCGGFPCQDVSLAGRRKGMVEGTRSGLWSEFARAIDALRPSLVVIENVRVLLSATAGGMESCTWCVGDGQDKFALRALGAVLGDLAELGFDAEWRGVRASDAGAPHQRFRIFIVAWPANSDGNGFSGFGRLKYVESDVDGRGGADGVLDETESAAFANTNGVGSVHGRSDIYSAGGGEYAFCDSGASLASA